jgi:glycosyltransferase involved in cell wall biosynthesis
VRALQARHPEITHLLLNENRGAGPAREAGRQLARGEFIQYLDSDDRLLPRKFEAQIQALRDRPECGAAYGQIRLFEKGKPPKETPHKWSGREIQTLFPALLVDRWWNTDAPLWRRSVCDRIGPWSELRYSQDWEHDARAGALGIKLAYCPEFVCEQRHHADVRQTGHGKWLAPADQVRFFSTLYQCALRAGVSQSTPEMRHFSRWVFSQARKCAAMTDLTAATSLLEIANRAAMGKSATISIYRFVSRNIGWNVALLISHGRDTFARNRAGKGSMKQTWM